MATNNNVTGSYRL